MRYNALVESVRLLDGASPSDHARLSRRTRRLPLAVDRDDDVAATMFLCRGVSGIPLLDVHELEMTDAGWQLLGGWGGPGDEAVEPRPHLDDLGAPAVSNGCGATARRGGRNGSWMNNYVYSSTVRPVAEVAVLVVGRRRLPVAGHGMSVIVWTREPPAVTALDATGANLGPIQLSVPKFPEARYRDE